MTVLENSRGLNAHRTQTAVQLQAFVNHALGGKSFAGSALGQLGVSAAHGAVCVESANAPVDHMAARKLLEASKSPLPHLAIDPATALKSFL